MQNHLAFACLALAALNVATPTSAQAQQSRPTLLGDSLRFRGAEWELVPIVSIDSSPSADTMAVRQIGRAFWLAAGRFVYEGRTTLTKKWALFGHVDGRPTRLAVSAWSFWRRMDAR